MSNFRLAKLEAIHELEATDDLLMLKFFKDYVK